MVSSFVYLVNWNIQHCILSFMQKFSWKVHLILILKTVKRALCVLLHLQESSGLFTPGKKTLRIYCQLQWDPLLWPEVNTFCGQKSNSENIIQFTPKGQKVTFWSQFYFTCSRTFNHFKNKITITKLDFIKQIEQKLIKDLWTIKKNPMKMLNIIIIILIALIVWTHFIYALLFYYIIFFHFFQL